MEDKRKDRQNEKKKVSVFINCVCGYDWYGGMYKEEKEAEKRKQEVELHILAAASMDRCIDGDF